MPRITTLPFLAAAWLLPGLAAADPASDVALHAANTAQTHCSEVYAEETAARADALVAVGEAWKAVGDAIEATDARWLLYWRGVLGDCLGQADKAIEDFEAFLIEFGPDETYAFLVKQARTRLKRLGAKGKLTEGLGGAWVRRRSRLDVDLAVAPGGGAGRPAVPGRHRRRGVDQCRVPAPHAGRRRAG
jgi:hypothetical protein